MATRPEIEEKLPEEEKGEHEYNKELEDLDVHDNCQKEVFTGCFR